jgi:hypothetical protein
MHRLQFGEHRADKNLRLDPKQKSLWIIRYPDCGTTKFPVRLQFETLVNSLQLQIKFDRVVMAGAHGNFLPPDDCDDCKISIRRRVNHNAINAGISERLTPQIKRRRMQIEEVREIKLVGLCSSRPSFAFCSRSSYAAVCKSEVGNDLF